MERFIPKGAQFQLQRKWNLNQEEKKVFIGWIMESVVLSGVNLGQKWGHF